MTSERTDKNTFGYLTVFLCSMPGIILVFPVAIVSLSPAYLPVPDILLGIVGFSLFGGGAILGILHMGCLLPAWHILRNHPNQRIAKPILIFLALLTIPVLYLTHKSSIFFLALL